MSSLEGTDASPSGHLVTPFSFHLHLASPRPRLPPPLLPPSASSSRAAAGSLRRAVTRVLTLPWRPCSGGTGCDRPGAAAGPSSAFPPAAAPRAGARGPAPGGAGNLWSVYTFWLQSPAHQKDGAPRAPEAASWGRRRRGQVWCPRVSPFCHAQAINLPGRARLKMKVLGGGGCRPRRGDPAPQA